MIPMRNGTKLATEIFLPPGGQPTAVILVRTPYGRMGGTNIFGDSAVDLFEQFAKTGRIILSVNASTHGGGNAKGVQFPIKGGGGKKANADFLEILGGAEPPKESILTYAVIGDYTDPSAPGNVKKVTSSWPPANTPTPFFFAPNGALQKNAPATASSVSFSYDPKNPAPTIGGGFSYGSAPNGAMDQRPLAERKDVLRFVSEPLAEPLEIAGKLRAELFISSDAPDTSFMVKFVDIYPDGQEIILREAGVLARFRDGKIASAPLEKGKTYKLAFPCNSIAAVFNKGHRIGILVTSSSTPAYEVHPNTWEPVTSMDKSTVANQTIHLGGADASRIFLPVVSSQ